MKTIGIFIGRFQPLHNAHLSVIRKALLEDEIDQLVIILGSDCQAKTIKNPWITNERIDMINNSLSENNINTNKVSFIPVKDYLYNDNLWLTELQSKLSQIEIDGNFYDIDDLNVKLFGHDKDRSTFYLHLFPKWDFVDVGSMGDFNATKVRELFFNRKFRGLASFCPKYVVEKLQQDLNSDDFERLLDEYNHVVNYKKMWSVAPYPPTFITTDAIVIKSGHVLVVRRKGNPGKGLIALPGGFLQADEKIIDGCLRELKEETGIKIPKDELKKRIVDEKVFDHPDRSLRGRTITNAFCIDLGAGNLPKVKGNDDADKAWWMSLRDVLRNEEMFFEDHWHILNYFISRY